MEDKILLCMRLNMYMIHHVSCRTFLYSCANMLKLLAIFLFSSSEQIQTLLSKSPLLIPHANLQPAYDKVCKDNKRNLGIQKVRKFSNFELPLPFYRLLPKEFPFIYRTTMAVMINPAITNVPIPARYTI